VVKNLTASDLDDPEVRSRLNNLWIDKGLLVFNEMAGGRQTQLKLSRVFGELEIHPVVEARMQEQPELTALIYNPGAGAVVAIDNEERGAYLPWHSDLIYVDRINRGGLLRAIRIPPQGGHTGFIDQIELYATLPDDLRVRVNGLSVIYHYDPTVKKFGKKAERRQPSPQRPMSPERYGHVAHPMVFTQVETGRKVLNVSPWFAVAIEGMENSEGDALLARIIDHCEDESRAYYHHWQPDDMVLWDNWRMLHSAYGVPKNETRHVERTTIKGDYQLGRVVRGAAFTAAQRVDI
jgi:taurine dioxygenase